MIFHIFGPCLESYFSAILAKNFYFPIFVKSLSNSLLEARITMKKGAGAPNSVASIEFYQIASQNAK